MQASIAVVAVLVLALSGVVSVTLASRASAATGNVIVACPKLVTVGSPGSGGCVSMDTAIAQATASAGDDTIELENGEYCPIDISPAVGHPTGSIAFVGRGMAQVEEGGGTTTVSGPTAGLSSIRWDSAFCGGSNPGYDVRVGRDDFSHLTFKNLTLDGNGSGKAFDGVEGVAHGSPFVALDDVIIQHAGIGVHWVGQDLTITRSTIQNNGTGVSIGGNAGIFNDTIYGNTDVGLTGTTFEIVANNDTISGNGYGIDAPPSASVMDLSNDLIADNQTDCEHSNDVTDFGHNVTGDSSCGTTFDDPSDQLNTGATLPAPGLNGGDTPSILPGNAARGYVVDHGASCPLLDQRGATREFPHCDVGSVQVFGSTAAVLSVSPDPHDFGPVNVGTTAHSLEQITNNSGNPVVVQNASASGVGFSAAMNSSCSDELEPGDSCNVTLSDHPTASGTQSGTLTINTDAGVRTVPLSADAVYPPPHNDAAPWIAGTAVVGSHLVGHDGGWTSSSAATITYQRKWLRCTDSGGGDGGGGGETANSVSCSAVAGATGTTYDVAPEDIGATLEFEVTAHDDNGDTTATSDPTGIVSEGSGPANDQFSHAQLITGASGTVDGSNIDATGEGDEPDNAGVSAPIASVWYAWTAPADGMYRFGLCGTTFDTTLGVYSGATVDALTSIAENDDSCSSQSQVDVDATAGQTYDISVAGNSGATGSFTLSWAKVVPVDHFSVTLPNAPAGGAFTVIATARDAAGNKITDYNEPAPTWSDLSGELSPTDPQPFVNGVSKTTGASIADPTHGDTVSVTTAAATGTSRVFNVYGPVDHFVLNPVSGVSAGNSFTVTATAQDALGSTVANYSDPTTWSDTSGELSPAAPAAFVNGVSSTSATITDPQTDDVIEVSNGSATGDTNHFRVLGALDHFAVTVPANFDVGSNVKVTAIARDSAGNKLVTYDDPSPAWLDQSGTLSPSDPHPFVNGVSKTTGASIADAYRADTITVVSGGEAGVSNPFNVHGPVDHFGVVVAPNVAAGAPFVVTATARDAGGNKVSAFNDASPNWSDLSGELSPSNPAAFVNGVSQTTTASIADPYRADTITVTSGAVAGTSKPVSVHGPIDHLTVNVLHDVTHGGTFTVTVTARDTAGNVVLGYNDTSPAWSDLSGSLSPTNPAPFVNGVSKTTTASVANAFHADAITETSGTFTSTSNKFNVT
ncbi:MAG: hypothetical protein JO214_08005 [Frankiaceae bacterium]|nr:hypothetical protein [Frankiaceae bacterium]